MLTLQEAVVHCYRVLKKHSMASPPHFHFLQKLHAWASKTATSFGVFFLPSFLLQDMAITIDRRNVTVDHIAKWQAEKGHEEDYAIDPEMTPTEHAEAFLAEANPVYKNYLGGYYNIFMLSTLVPV
jgi:hypothetical protein